MIYSLVTVIQIWHFNLKLISLVKLKKNKKKNSHILLIQWNIFTCNRGTTVDTNHALPLKKIFFLVN